MEKVLILGGVTSHIGLIKKLKARGYVTVLVDYLPDSPAKNYADIHEQASCLDAEIVMSLAEKHSATSVLSSHLDRTLPVAAVVSEQLGISYYLNESQAFKLTNKSAMKEMFCAAKIPSAKYKIVTQIRLEEVDDLAFPVICKEVDGTGSQGLVIVEKKADFERLSKVTYEHSEQKPILVEEFIEGREFSVDVTIRSGLASVLAVRERKKCLVQDGSSILCHGAVRLMDLPSRVVSELRQIGQKVADGVGLNNSPLMIQVIYTKSGELSVVEVAARISGGITSRYLGEATGVDLLDFSVSCQLNEVPIDQMIGNDHWYVVKILYAKEGFISHFVGLEQCLEEGVVDSYHLLRTSGDQMPSGLSTKSRVAEVVIKCATKDEVGSKVQQVFDKVKVLDAEHQDILLRDDNFVGI
jgi:biotin carboxylase